ncbi:hypothetical protein Pcinc_025935 [Petrolisthes cinctipes]|uniref:Uncharacterized protein n=1 Tax=Petrolisthes cinctipes TaxID=88211 RepID=A0AAE1F8A9_PETCI|nr:hypothetical protein Pcinc_025935 [Petrolisthes cinctipes]
MLLRFPVRVFGFPLVRAPQDSFYTLPLRMDVKIGMFVRFVCGLGHGVMCGRAVGCAGSVCECVWCVGRGWWLAGSPLKYQRARDPSSLNGPWNVAAVESPSPAAAASATPITVPTPVTPTTVPLLPPPPHCPLLLPPLQCPCYPNHHSAHTCYPHYSAPATPTTTLPTPVTTTIIISFPANTPSIIPTYILKSPPPNHLHCFPYRYPHTCCLHCICSTTINLIMLHSTVVPATKFTS